MRKSTKKNSQLKARQVALRSGRVAAATRYGDRYRWLAARADERVPMSLFDTRTQTCLQRAGAQTWGDLAELSDQELATLPSVGQTTIRQINKVLAAEDWCTLYSVRHPWMESITDEPVPFAYFDVRSQTCLRRARVQTWGDLGQLSDAILSDVPGAGELTVSRVNDVLAEHARSLRPLPVAEASDERAALAGEKAPLGPTSPAQTKNVATQEEPDAAEDLLNLLAASCEWAAAVGVATTLGELIDELNGDLGVPAEVAKEVNELLSLRLADAAPSLGSLLDQLLSEARDPELLITRECVRRPPTLESLAQEQGVTRERVRQKVARDVEQIQLCLETRHYLPVRWTVQRFRDDVGLLVRIDSEVVERWRQRCGSHHFEVLRWLAGYSYDGDWLLSNKDAVAQFQTELAQLTRDEWLLSVDTFAERLSAVADPDMAVRFLVESGTWRDIGDGWLVRWDGPIQAKAERVLRLTCTPMTPEELVAAIGHGSERSIKNQHGDRLIRVDKEFRLGLREWGLEEYEGIVPEIRQRIERGGGVASVAAIIDEFTRVFGVSVSSIQTYLSLPMFSVTGDSVRLGDDTEFSPRSPAGAAGAVQTAAGWGERQVVAEAALKGYSFSLNPHIAWANGLRPGDDLLAPVNGSTSHKASVIWRTTSTTGRVDVGRMREWLVDHSVAIGTEVLICPTPDDVTVFVGHEQIEAARRALEARAPALAPDIASLMEQL